MPIIHSEVRHPTTENTESTDPSPDSFGVVRHCVVPLLRSSMPLHATRTVGSWRSLFRPSSNAGAEAAGKTVEAAKRRLW